MKIQIDTKQKTLKLEESVNLGDFLEALKKLFPDGEWKEYKLETNTIINNWTNPIIIDRWGYPTYPWITPYYTTGGDFTITSKTDSGDFSVQQGVYNVSL